MAKVKEWGISQIIEDSSGNSGAAIAAYAAVAGIQCEIYVPASTSEGKIKQIAAYGAQVVKVPGNRDATAQAAMERAQSVYYASHSWNPIFCEGTKTIAYEIWEQLGFTVPDVVIVPIGSGTLILGLYAGFCDLLQMNQISRLPKILGVQSTHCSPAYTDLQGFERRPVTPTIAEGISVGHPIRQTEILKAIRGTAGEVLVVEDDEVSQGMQELSRIGIYVEPTSATVVAAYHQAREKGLLCADDRVVLPLTGSGLKKG
jgi:threonine synthase